MPGTPVWHWPELASIVAREDTIPIEKMTALKYMIYLREEIGKLIYDDELPFDEELGHELFIVVVNLRIVLKILTRDPRKTTNSPPRYDSTVVVESGAKAREQSAKKAPEPQVYRMGALENDGLFAWLNFLQGVMSIRNQVCKVWDDYAHGYMSLVSVSLSMNTTIEMLRAYCHAHLRGY
ncbi:hypothetical protein F4775DRAFT_221739 [Biscogniauxia sp. FL1348]|nr:hypothetical protein F4775DRAFT_221739 [Biscogniauxia sp. FL1348]